MPRTQAEITRLTAAANKGIVPYDARDYRLPAERARMERSTLPNITTRQRWIHLLEMMQDGKLTPKEAKELTALEATKAAGVRAKVREIGIRLGILDAEWARSH